MKNTNHVDLIDKHLNNVHFIKINSIPIIEEQLTPKFHIDQVIPDGVDNSSILRLDPDEKLKLDDQDSIIPNSALTLPKTKNELPTKSYVDNKFDDPIFIRNIAHIDWNDRNNTKARYIQVNQMPQFNSHLTAKLYVDKKFNDPSIFKNRDHVDFNDKNLDNVEWTKVKKMPKIEEHLTPKLYVDRFIHDIRSYVDGLHEIIRNRRGLSSVFNDQDNEFDNNKLTILDSVTVNRNPSSDNEVSNKKYVDDSIGEGTLLRFNSTLQKYLKVTV